MNQRHARVALVIVSLLFAGRLWSLKQGGAESQVVAVAKPVLGRNQSAMRDVPQAASDADRALQFDWPVRTAQQGGSPDEAFASRAEAMAAQAQHEAAKRLAPQQVMVPIAPPPPLPIVRTEPQASPPSIRVIGTWEQGGQLALFVSGPEGTAMAKQGETLWAKYQVTAINRKALTLQELPGGRSWAFSVPAESANEMDQRGW
jgi:hypothetical protein